MSDKNEAFTLPTGRMINGSLFTRDQFSEKAKPRYNIEIAFEADALAQVEEMLSQAAQDKWGGTAGEDYWSGKIRSPIIMGDELKARREAKGKPGDAYAGMHVVRAHTLFNADGHEGPGGISTYDEEGEPVDAVRQSIFYNGCFVNCAVVISTYEPDGGGHALMFYLTAVQKDHDGDKLASAADHSTLFNKVGRTPGEGASRRRTRAG